MNATAKLQRSLWVLGGCVLCIGAAAAQTPPPAGGTLHDDQLAPRHRPYLNSARLGAEWLFAANETDGRFRFGVNPIIQIALPDDGLLAQADAAAALARAARLFGQERYGARAKQALLALLAQTKADPQNPELRYTGLPAATLNRAAAASGIVRAIHELPDPAKDLLEQGEQLVNFLRTTQQADGSFALGEQVAPLPHQRAEEMEQRHLATHGAILAAILRSYGRAPAPWKLESARRALGFYHSRWQANPAPGPTPGLLIAFADAYALTKEKSFAEAALEMGDWLLALQYGADARQPLWEGGFAGWKDGKLEHLEPTTEGAPLLEALAAALRTARAVGDVGRFDRLRGGVERGAQFLVTHQYTAANVTHFAEWFQPKLVGSYFTSARIGANPLSQTARATQALAACTLALAEVRAP
jgi:hypothetical protein